MDNNPTPPIPDNGEREKEIEQLKAKFVAWRAERMKENLAIGGENRPDNTYYIWHWLQQELHTAIEEERKRFVEDLRNPDLNTGFVTSEVTGNREWTIPFSKIDELVAKYSPSDKETTK